MDPHNDSRGNGALNEELDVEQLIRVRAFLLWQAEGEAEGREEEYWQRARELIEAETQSSYPPTQSRGYRT